MMQWRTGSIIVRRLSIIRNAGLILLMLYSQIAERGTTEELQW